MPATDTLLSPERARAAQRAAIALVAVAGVVAGALVLAIEPVSDFLGEGAVRVLGMDGGGRRLLIGTGLLAATAVALVALARGGASRYLLAGAAVIVALFIGGPAALPFAAALVIALAVTPVAGLTHGQLERAAPRRHPAAWAGGSVVAVVAVVVAGWIGWRLTAPLFDKGRELNETLAFTVAAPASGAAADAAGSASTPSGGGAAGGNTGTSTDASAAGSVVSMGELNGVDSFHTGSGQVLLVRAPDGAAVLRFEDYAVRNGPDLRIYLTPDPDGDVFADGAVDLGPIKATRGNVNYDVPPGVDLASFRTAVVYCFGFRVTFATAALD